MKHIFYHGITLLKPGNSAALFVVFRHYMMLLRSFALDTLIWVVVIMLLLAETCCLLTVGVC